MEELTMANSCQSADLDGYAQRQVPCITHSTVVDESDPCHMRSSLLVRKRERQERLRGLEDNGEFQDRAMSSQRLASLAFLSVLPNSQVEQRN